MAITLYRSAETGLDAAICKKSALGDRSAARAIALSASAYYLATTLSRLYDFRGGTSVRARYIAGPRRFQLCERACRAGQPGASPGRDRQPERHAIAPLRLKSESVTRSVLARASAFSGDIACDVSGLAISRVTTISGPLPYNATAAISPGSLAR